MKLQDLRGTGRTTRMLNDAKRLAGEGRAVYVITDSLHTAHRLREACGSPELGIKFETAQTPGNFEWDTLRLVGAHPNCVVLVDHYAIERRFAAVLEMLHRYDGSNNEAR